MKVLEGGDDILPTELAHITKRESREGHRLACRVAVKKDMQVEVPPEVFETKKWVYKVKSNDSVSNFIKELILELPEGEVVDFKAGGYIQIDVPRDEVDISGPYGEFFINETDAEMIYLG